MCFDSDEHNWTEAKSVYCWYDACKHSFYILAPGGPYRRRQRGRRKACLALYSCAVVLFWTWTTDTFGCATLYSNGVRPALFRGDLIKDGVLARAVRRNRGS